MVGQLGGVDAALANHLVMGPVILARAGLDYALKVHGSDLSYTVLPDLERFGPYAQEAWTAPPASSSARATSRPASARPSTTRQTNAKVRLGPPGVDTEPLHADPPAERRRSARGGQRKRLGGGGGARTGRSDAATMRLGPGRRGGRRSARVVR